MIFSQRFKASLLVLTGAASYGILSTCVKLAYKDGFSPAEVTGSQVMFGFVALWLLSIRCWGYMKKMPRIVFLKLLGSGVFTGLTGVFYYFALQTLSASFAVLLLFQFTWMGLLADWLLQKKRPTVFSSSALSSCWPARCSPPAFSKAACLSLAGPVSGSGCLRPQAIR
ncbi:EamA family transporter [Paenibacillus elgii]|uniref:EamA family transporter n=1 Tax=Paenibacillus elgii TaxID=189691 RepID=UPI001EF8D7D1|nr:EamA family transporter [Paenibacillus elgii]